MNELYKKLLNYYQIDEEQYKILTRDLTLADIPDPYEFNGMKEAVEIAKQAIANKDKVMVYGDYDCDGIMSTSIVVKVFLKLGMKIGYYVPSRYIDGYGLTIDRAKQIVQKGYKVLITVDNGISANEPIAYCKDHGMKVIIIDHHQYHDDLPNADAIVHPQVSNFSTQATSAGYCSFIFSCALLGKIDEYLLILGAISVISDMMPLKNFNRDIVRLATILYEKGKYLALDLLREGDEFDYMSIGMRMAPKINAVGRVLKTTQINRLIEFLTTDNPSMVYEIYKMVEQCNEYRKELSKNADLELTEEESKLPGVVKVMDIQEGLIGILANKALNTYKVPSIVFCEDSQDKDLLRGSCRAGEGFNIVKCFDELADILVIAGGHAFAGGLTLKKENLEEFTKRFMKVCEEHPIVDVKEESIVIGIQDVSFETYELIKNFSPFGEEWKAPLLEIQNIKTSALQFSKKGEHILTPIGQNTKLVGFNMPREEVLQSDYIDMIGNVNFYIYRGSRNIQFLTKKYRKSNINNN